MTCRARPGGSRVIHRGRREGGKVLVTGVTLTTGRNVIGGFSEGRNAVTGRTATATNDNRRRMGIAEVGRPGIGRLVAGIALGGGRRVVARLDLGILRQISPTMTGRTLTKHGIGMEHHRRRPGGEPFGVTGIALGTDWNMACRLGQGVN